MAMDWQQNVWHDLRRASIWRKFISLILNVVGFSFSFDCDHNDDDDRRRRYKSTTSIVYLESV